MKLMVNEAETIILLAFLLLIGATAAALGVKNSLQVAPGQFSAKAMASNSASSNF